MLIAVQDSNLRTELARNIGFLYPSLSISMEENGAAALLSIKEHNPDIAFLQDKLPLLDAFDVIKKSRQDNTTNTSFIMLSQQIKMEQFHQAKELNFSAYLSTNDIETDLQDCIKSILNKNCFISNSMSKLISKFGEISNKLASLSQTEKLFLNEIHEGKDVKEISEKLVLSNKSIKQLTKSIGEKLQIDNGIQDLEQWAKDHMPNLS